MVVRSIGKLNQTFHRNTTNLLYVIDKRYHIEHTWSRTRIEPTILSLSRTDCICYCKIHYHMLVVAKIHKYSNNHTEQRTTERKENAHINRGVRQDTSKGMKKSLSLRTDNTVTKRKRTKE